MKICHIYESAFFESGGVVRYIYDQGRGIANRGHTVELCTCNTSEHIVDSQRAWGDAVRLHSLSSAGLSRYLFRSKRNPVITSLFESCSVIHIHGLWSPVSLSIARYAFLQNIPYVITLHGMLDDWSMSQRGFKKRLYLRAFANSMLVKASAVITSTTKEREQALHWLPDSRVEVLPPVMDLDPFLELPSKDTACKAYFPEGAPERPVVLFLSRIHEKKGAEILIRAMKILEGESCQCNLVIAGVGDDRYVQSLKCLVSELGLEPLVRFVGMVDGELKASLYAMADVFVLPTAQENFGLVFTESMACGTPVLTSAGIDICDELEQSGGAVLSERTPEAFATALIHMLKDDSNLKAMGDKGREWVFREFSVNHILDAHESLYETVGKKDH